MRSSILLEFIVFVWIVSILGVLFTPSVSRVPLSPRPWSEVIPITISIAFGLVGCVGIIWLVCQWVLSWFRRRK